MVAFDVFHNNERLCVAGVGDFGVLTACVTWVAHRPEQREHWTAEAISEEQSTELNLQVGGVKNDGRASPLHMRWSDANLRVGDEIKIRVIDAPRVAAAATEYRDDPVKDVEEKKRYVRRLARELGWEIRES